MLCVGDKVKIDLFKVNGSFVKRDFLNLCFALENKVLVITKLKIEKHGNYFDTIYYTNKTKNYFFNENELIKI